MYCGYRIERRRFQRLMVNLAVLYRIEGPQHILELLEKREFEGETVDLSEGGAALLTGHYLPLETELSIKFLIQESDHRGDVNFHELFDLRGEVRSVVPSENAKYRLGICFKKLVRPEKEKIFDLMGSSLHFES